MRPRYGTKHTTIAVTIEPDDDGPDLECWSEVAIYYGEGSVGIPDGTIEAGKLEHEHGRELTEDEGRRAEQLIGCRAEEWRDALADGPDRFDW